MIITASLACTGCGKFSGARPDYQVVISNRFSSDQIEKTINALDEWKRKTGILDYRVGLTDVPQDYDGQRNYIAVKPMSVTKDLKDTDTTNHVVGFYHRNDDDNSTEIGMPIDRQSTVENFSQIIRHELGHAFGLEHYEGLGTSVMTSFRTDSRASDTVTCEDVKAFCEVWNCNTECIDAPDTGTF